MMSALNSNILLYEKYIVDMLELRSCVPLEAYIYRNWAPPSLKCIEKTKID